MRQRSDARILVDTGVATDMAEARRMLRKAKVGKPPLDAIIFYHNSNLVHVNFRIPPENRRLYANRASGLWTAQVSAGLLAKVKKMTIGDGHLVIGRLKQFKSRDKKVAKLVAQINNPVIQPGHDGIFLSPYSALEVHERGGETHDERCNLVRMEFQPIDGDHIVGMFAAWKSWGGSSSLVLYISVSKLLAYLKSR